MRTIPFTVGASVVGFDPEIYSPNQRPYPRAVITVGAAGIRFVLDGSEPTATYGHIGSTSQTITLENEQEVAGFRAIRSGGSDSECVITFTQKPQVNV
jgi:hypothetical protein